MRDKGTITIPLNKVSYEDLEALTIEQQTQLFVKDKEIERLKNIINELEKYLNKVIQTSTEQEKITCSFVLQYLQELKGSDKE